MMKTEQRAYRFQDLLYKIDVIRVLQPFKHHFHPAFWSTQASNLKHSQSLT